MDVYRHKEEEKHKEGDEKWKEQEKEFVNRKEMRR